MSDSHCSDADLLLLLHGEATLEQTAGMHAHCERCSPCRTRKLDLAQTIEEFVAEYRAEVGRGIPNVERSRKNLRARLSRAAAEWPRRRMVLASAAAVIFVIAAGLLVRQQRDDSAPNAAWTPGAVKTTAREAVCMVPDRGGPPRISASLAQAVFERYGIQDPQPRSYEVDYLIPPSLGGSGDIRNLWPQPYSSGVWTARVKDALEDRLLSLVCGEKLDLATAQADLARNWIAAYKKYFETEQPLPDHFAFVKDRPWE